MLKWIGVPLLLSGLLLAVFGTEKLMDGNCGKKYFILISVGYICLISGLVFMVI